MIIFSCCAIPLIQQPYGLLHKEKKQTEALEIERIAEIAFANTFVKMARQEWKWSELLASEKKPIQLNPEKQNNPISKDWTFSTEYTVTIQCKKKSSASLLMKVSIDFFSKNKRNSSKFDYLIWIEKKGSG